MVGDFYGKVVKSDINGTIRRYGQQTITSNSEKIIGLCELNELKIPSGFHEYKAIHKFTWSQEKQNLKTIFNYVIVTKDTAVVIKDVRIKSGLECGSNHGTLVVGTELPWKQITEIAQKVARVIQ